MWTMKGFTGSTPAGARFPVAVSPTPSGISHITTDGSYIKVEVLDNVDDNIPGDGSTLTTANWDQRQWIMYFPDGRRVEGMGSQTDKIIDRNGNSIRVVPGTTPLGDPQVKLVDDLNREIVIEMTVSGDHRVQAAGTGGQTLTWNVKRVTVNRGPIDYKCAEHASLTDQQKICSLDAQYTEISEIDFPIGDPLTQTDPIKYKFEYHAAGFGELNGIELVSKRIGGQDVPGLRAEYDYHTDADQERGRRETLDLL